MTDKIDVQLKGITLKQVKVEDDYEPRFTVNIAITVETFDDAVNIAKKVDKIENMLKGQQTLEESG